MTAVHTCHRRTDGGTAFPFEHCTGCVTVVQSGQLLTRDGAPVSGIVHAGEFGAMGELLRAVPYSTDHAMRHEGYGVRTLPAPVLVWTDDERRRHADTARNVMRHERWHDTGRVPADYADTYPDGWPADEFADIRSSCGGCALRGHGAHDDDGWAPFGPNYAGWARIYVESGTPVPDVWRDAFLSELDDTDDDGTVTPYARCLRVSVRTFGVRYAETAAVLPVHVFDPSAVTR